jgi:hypothetical protein
MSRLTRAELALVAVSVVLSLVAIELAARVYDGKLKTWTNFVRAAYVEMARSKTDQDIYDPIVGWRGRPGYAADGVTLDERGLRLAGSLPSPINGAPILLSGDSNTFGAEVRDEETWAAHLQALTGRRVLNAGMPAYGFDQTVLRAEIEAPLAHPADIVIGFIAHDLPRMEASRLWTANRPYFDIVDGQAVLRNLPVPAPADPRRPMPVLKAILGYSYVIDFLIRRVGRGAPWYEETVIANPPGTGARIACLLMTRLRALQQATGARILVVAQYDTEAWQSRQAADEERQATGPQLACARANGLSTLDSFEAIAAWTGEGGPAALYKEHHMNDAGNRLFAGLIAQALAERTPAPK